MAQLAGRTLKAAFRADQIAERADLTRGAVYSNFPSKRALYFAVLAQAAQQAPDPEYPPTARTVGAALADFARAWMARLPLAIEDQRSATRLGRDLLPEIVGRSADQSTVLSVDESQRDRARAVPGTAASAETESEVRIQDGRIVALADGYGACHAAASA